MLRHDFLRQEVFPDSSVLSLPCPTFLCAPAVTTVLTTWDWKENPDVSHLPVNIPFLLSVVSILESGTKIRVFEIYCNKALIQQNWMNDDIILCCKLPNKEAEAVFSCFQFLPEGIKSWNEYFSLTPSWGMGCVLPALHHSSN